LHRELKIIPQKNGEEEGRKGAQTEEATVHNRRDLATSRFRDDQRVWPGVTSGQRWAHRDPGCTRGS